MVTPVNFQICGRRTYPDLNPLTHCCAWPARAVATSTTSDPAPMTTARRLCTRDPLPPVVSRSSLAGQVDASRQGHRICPARGWHSAGGCGLAHLVVGGKHVPAMSIFCQLWWEVDPSALSVMVPNGIIGDVRVIPDVQDASLCLHVKSLQSGRVGFGQSPRLISMQQDGLNKGRVDSQFRIQTYWVDLLFLHTPCGETGD